MILYYSSKQTAHIGYNTLNVFVPYIQTTATAVISC